MTFFKNTRRDFIKGLTATSVLSATSIPVIARSLTEDEAGNLTKVGSPGSLANEDENRPVLYDGPRSPLFDIIPFEGNTSFSSLPESVSERMAKAADQAPVGPGTAWGIPFQIPDRPVLVKDKSFTLQITSVQANYLVFLHTSDLIELRDEQGDYKKPFMGTGQLNDEVADYVIVYSDGTEERSTIRERQHIGMFRQHWGENSILSVAHHKPKPLRAHHEQMTGVWGSSQTRVSASDRGDWINWLWAWKNPHPEKHISGFRFEPK
ncbi:MAG: twin-arginine translocation signal domain-containing protein, partial [Bacteroidales bacterium]|nr:twin-arginine translocation signal domain-containing protein [Bacteroidales bacterium]